MEPQVRRLTNKYSMISAVVSFATQLVPGADELIVVPIHYRFSFRLTRMRDRSLLDVPWMQLHKIIWGGAFIRLFANFSLGIIPVVGAFSNAVTAVALTEFLARYLDESLTRPGAAEPVSMDPLKSSTDP
jgi:hypothetical protein